MQGCREPRREGRTRVTPKRGTESGKRSRARKEQQAGARASRVTRPCVTDRRNERSRDRPDLEGQAPPHSCTCTEGTKELRSRPPPRIDIAFRALLSATAALCGKGSSQRLDGHPSP